MCFRLIYFGDSPSDQGETCTTPCSASRGLHLFSAFFCPTRTNRGRTEGGKTHVGFEFSRDPRCIRFPSAANSWVPFSYPRASSSSKWAHRRHARAAVRLIPNTCLPVHVFTCCVAAAPATSSCYSSRRQPTFAVLPTPASWGTGRGVTSATLVLASRRLTWYSVGTLSLITRCVSGRGFVLAPTDRLAVRSCFASNGPTPLRRRLPHAHLDSSRVEARVSQKPADNSRG